MPCTHVHVNTSLTGQIQFTRRALLIRDDKRPRQGRSQPKCDGGASQLSSTVANLYAIHQYGPIKLFTLYFLNKSAL